jgi:glutamate synthase (NADPH/NADH) small chain
VLEADLVLLAVGFEGPVRDRLLDDLALDLSETGAVRRDERYRTSVPGVFAAGYATRGASLIVWAIAEGRRAAHEIDCHLMGRSFLPR